MRLKGKYRLYDDMLEIVPVKMKKCCNNQIKKERSDYMQYITSKEAAVKWSVSERMVRKYCTQNRIKDTKYKKE